MDVETVWPMRCMIAGESGGSRTRDGVPLRSGLLSMRIQTTLTTQDFKPL